jgi:hypothetical protein
MPRRLPGMSNRLTLRSNIWRVAMATVCPCRCPRERQSLGRAEEQAQEEFMMDELDVAAAAEIRAQTAGAERSVATIGRDSLGESVKKYLVEGRNRPGLGHAEWPARSGEDRTVRE